jgi:hypothetical protein
MLGVAFLQLLLFVWQLWLIRKSLDDAKATAQAAKHAADAAKTEAEIASRTLTKVQRPYLFVFGVKYLDNDPAPYVKYTVANYGQTPAIIDDIGAAFDNDPALPLRVRDDHSLLISPIMPPGEIRSDLRDELPTAVHSGETKAVYDDAVRETRTIAIPKVESGEELFFRVFISYRGPFTSDHVTSACWRYLPDNNHFVQYGHREYNFVR